MYSFDYQNLAVDAVTAGHGYADVGLVVNAYPGTAPAVPHSLLNGIRDNIVLDRSHHPHLKIETVDAGRGRIIPVEPNPHDLAGICRKWIRIGEGLNSRHAVAGLIRIERDFSPERSPGLASVLAHSQPVRRPDP